MMLSYMEEDLNKNDKVLDQASKTFLDQLPVGIIVVDEKSNVLYKNSIAADHAGAFSVNGEEKSKDSHTIRSAGSEDEKKSATIISIDQIKGFRASVAESVAVNKNESISCSSESGEYICLRRIGHEINNFLTVLQLRCEMMRMVLDDPEKANTIIEQLFGSLNCLKQFANNLLFIGKACEWPVSAINITQMLQNLPSREDVLVLLNGRPLEIDGPEETAYIRGNPDLLEMLLYNTAFLDALINPKGGKTFLTYSIDESTVKIVTKYRTKGFPKSELETLLESRDLKSIKLSNKNVVVACIVNAADCLHGSVAITDSDEETLHLLFHYL